ncbi:GntR family transcriptional regulator [Labrys monachus]|uniref:DNA-binding GntR family transcriptional regulator n=1 Tax=Labrys monachus TaxID=217067 RepID=A0ABU0FFG9_9HYPH|nr:GntR family transcriptional regulator [Labrys monachus]MDQ0393355.1 DNA-binding GntR family transcriptional regulator [Labrys monachus]
MIDLAAGTERASEASLPDARTRPGTPLYLLVAKALQEDIRSGKYAVGSLLPTELALAEQHGVSRQTIRQAIGQLRQQGLLSARKGIGTRVEARQTQKRFSYSVMSATDLVEIAEGTELLVQSSEIVAAKGRLATELGCRANHRWLHLGCQRRIDGEPQPLSWIDVYIDWRFASSLKLPKVVRQALFVLVEKQSGEALTEIHQEIRATIVDGRMAAELSAVEGEPALEITRRYFGTGRRLLMMSINILPSDRFFYSVSLKRD